MSENDDEQYLGADKGQNSGLNAESDWSFIVSNCSYKCELGGNRDAAIRFNHLAGLYTKFEPLQPPLQAALKLSAED